jgi:uncharacterized coiled-coil protein SlyX
MSEERLIGIETALAYHEEQIASLSEVIARQWQEIEALKRLLRQAQAKLEDIEAASGEDKPLSVSDQAARDKPPHY